MFIKTSFGDVNALLDKIACERDTLHIMHIMYVYSYI